MTEDLINLLGKTFAGTVITDPVLDPYIIICYGPGDFAVCRKRLDPAGKLKLSFLKYPSSFCRGLEIIAKEKMCEKREYLSIQDYIDAWKEVASSIRNVYKDWKIDSI